MKKIYLLLLIGLAGGTCYESLAQEPNFSMYHHTPFLTNPGMIGVQEDVRLMLNYRNQSVDAGENFTTSMLSGYYPVNVGNHRLGLAATFLSDKASDFMKTNGGMLGVAYSVNFSEGMELSLGVQGGYFQRKLDAGFTTDDQFVNGGFDPNVPSSERLFNETRGYPLLSSGLYWQWKDPEGRLKAFAGGSVYNFTQPNVSFTDTGKDGLPVSLRGSAGMRVYQGMNFSIMPTVRWVSQGSNDFVNMGSWFRYDLPGTVKGARQVGLGLWYNSNDAGVVSLEYEQSNLTMAASYDLPISSEINAVQKTGVFELAISFRIKKVERKKRAASPPLTMVPEADPVEESSIEEEPVPEEVLEEPQPEPIQETIVEEKKESVQPSLSETDLSVLGETVKFKINSFDLTDGSKVFLNNVVDVLKRNDWFNVELVGHACDLGSEKLNFGLSTQRADKVQQYLLENGIATKRISFKGEGEKNPIESNQTEEGRRKNRRVEFKVVE